MDDCYHCASAACFGPKTQALKYFVWVELPSRPQNDQAVRDGEGRRGGACRCVYSGEGIADVAVYGSFAQPQAFGDLTICQTLGHQLKDLGLARREKPLFTVCRQTA